MNDHSTLFDILTNMSPEFAKTRMFRVNELKTICESEGMPWKRKYMSECVKIKYPVYQYTGKVELALVKPAPTLTAAPSKKEASLQNNNFSHVPAVDTDYVPFGDYRDIEKIIDSKLFYPVLVTGHSGNGKTMSIMQACAKFKRPMIRVNCTKKTDEESLIGSKTLIDGNVVVVEGPLLTCMRSGAIFLADEFSASDPNAILCIQGIMEGKPFYFSLTGEHITPAKGFNVFLTDNTKGQGSEDGRYVGTNILNEAFLERIGSVIEQEYPPQSVELKIVLRRMETRGCVDKQFAEELVKWAQAIRRVFADGGIDSVISTRRLGHIVDNFSIFRDKNKAIVQCTNRFDELTKMAFVTLFSKITTDGAMDIVKDAPAVSGTAGAVDIVKDAPAVSGTATPW